MSEPHSEPDGIVENVSSWEGYYEHHQGREPYPEYHAALEAIRETHPDLSEVTALDVGAGALIEAQALLEAGVGRVIATDANPHIERRALDLSLRYNQSAADFDRFDFQAVANEAIARVVEPDSVDLILSYHGLPFTNPAEFEATWGTLRAGLRPGGIMSVTLFGDHDSWSERFEGMTFLSREDISRMTQGLEEISLQETEVDASAASGHDRHYHIFKLLYRRPV